MRFSNNVINFLRGDDDALVVGLKDGVFETGDVVYFCVRGTATTNDDLLQVISTTFIPYQPTGAAAPIENAGALINISHDQTINLPLGTYYYTIWVEWTNGTYVTIIPPTKFILDPGGSHV